MHLDVEDTHTLPVVSLLESGLDPKLARPTCHHKTGATNIKGKDSDTICGLSLN